MRETHDIELDSHSHLFKTAIDILFLNHPCVMPMIQDKRDFT